MKKAGQQTRFRDDLRRLLLFYSLLPVLSAVLLSLQSQLELDAFRSSVNYQAAVKSRIYQFINQGGISAAVLSSGR